MSIHPHIFEVDEEGFAERVLAQSAERPVLVDFAADWCAPCRFLAPVITQVMDEYAGQVVLAKLDTDENMRLAGRYKVRGFPTVVLFIDGEEVDRFDGAKPAAFIRDFIDFHLHADERGQTA